MIPVSAPEDLGRVEFSVRTDRHGWVKVIPSLDARTSDLRSFVVMVDGQVVADFYPHHPEFGTFPQEAHEANARKLAIQFAQDFAAMLNDA